MKKTMFYISLALPLSFFSCKNDKIAREDADVKVVFLHHSTGRNIWMGKKEILSKLNWRFEKSTIEGLMNKHNKEHGTKIFVEEMYFPKADPYGWNNYPYDYYNIWVKNAGPGGYMTEPSLEMLAGENDLIIWKHCYPVSNIQADEDIANIDSPVKTLANYKLQYAALKEKMNSFPNVKFLVWTGAALVKNETNEEEALRAKEFFDWVINEWDEEGDNIFLWDFYSLATEGSLYLLDKYAYNPYDSHPNPKFSEKAAHLLFNRMVDVVRYDGANTTLTGHDK